MSFSNVVGHDRCCIQGKRINWGIGQERPKIKIHSLYKIVDSIANEGVKPTPVAVGEFAKKYRREGKNSDKEDDMGQLSMRKETEMYCFCERFKCG